MAGRTGAVALLLMACLAGHVSLRAEEAATEPPEMLVVMTDGRILKGQVARHAVGYYVERLGGSILVPHEQIRCVARDLTDAYRRQREQMVDPTSTMLIQLAEWCISYRMYDEAGDELRRALRRDPENEVAREMLGRLDEMLRAQPTRSMAVPQMDAQGLPVADVEALGGLSREKAAEFTAKVQPLLINKCGNASCHGTAATNEFRLSHVRVGSPNHRRSAEQNLALVLRYIDVAEPEASQLLQTIKGSHGGSAYAIFGGAAGAAQSDLLQKWVIAVAEERQTEAQKLARRTRLKSKPAAADPIPSAVQPAALEVTVSAPTGDSVTPVAMEEPRQEAAAVSPPRPLPRHDPFDPEEFNRRYGGQPAPAPNR